MKKTIIVILMASMFLMLASPALAFDKYRKGFVLVLGGGAGLTTFKDEYSTDRESKFALFTNFEIGYAPSDQLMILYSNVVPWFKATYYHYDYYGDILYSKDYTTISAITGITVTYFLNVDAPSFFFGGGIGLATLDTPFEEGTDAATGLGLMGKLGYEFTRNAALTVHIMYGKPKYSAFLGDYTINIFNLGITMNWLAY